VVEQQTESATCDADALTRLAWGA